MTPFATWDGRPRLPKVKKPRKPRQLPMAFLRCSASLKSGVRCHYKNKYGEFCGHHRQDVSMDNDGGI